MSEQQPRNPILGVWQDFEGEKPSEKTLLVGGINATVYGLEELGDGIDQVACFWLLHPRSCSRADSKRSLPIFFSVLVSGPQLIQSALSETNRNDYDHHMEPTSCQ